MDAVTVRRGGNRWLARLCQGELGWEGLEDGIGGERRVACSVVIVRTCDAPFCLESVCTSQLSCFRFFPRVGCACPYQWEAHRRYRWPPCLLLDSVFDRVLCFVPTGKAELEQFPRVIFGIVSS